MNKSKIVALTIGLTALAGCVTNPSTPNSRLNSSIIQSWKAADVCKKALRKNSSAWDTKPSAQVAVNEAKKRGFTPDGCAIFAGRTVRADGTIRDKPPQRTPANPSPTKRPETAQTRPVQPPPQPQLIPIGTGSGIIVSADGHILTNHHVISRCRAVSAGFNINDQQPSNIIDSDASNDIALIQADGKKLKNLNFARFRMMDPELGEEIIVAGFPFASILSDSIKVTRGIVSSSRGIGNDSSIFQFDAAVQPGNSGGPIYDEGGKIVGIVSSRLDSQKMESKFGSNAENISFGIKISTIKQFVSSTYFSIKENASRNSIPTREVASIAQTQTVQIICYGLR